VRQNYKITISEEEVLFGDKKARAPMTLPFPSSNYI